MKLKTTRAIIAGKAGSKAINLINKDRGTIWAGKKAMEIDPDILSSFTGVDPARVLFVTGTNGKSTVTNMISCILMSKGYKVVSNNGGANLTSGVASALIKNASVSGKIDADYCIFETDERYLHQIAKQFPCANLLVTNLEKDQVQRNGDPDFIYRKIAACVDEFDMRLFLNGDEPRSCSLADHSDKTVFFGVEKHSRAFVKDDTFVTLPCPKCRGSIRFDFHNNDGMGAFRCKNCGYTNNNGGEADYIVREADFEKYSFTVNGANFKMLYPQAYMLYNYAAAVAVCKELAGVSEQESADALIRFRIPDGRMEEINYKGNNIKYFRFKQENPETLQNFINAAAADPDEKVLVIGFGTVNDIDPHYINSFYAFDCDYSALKNAHVKKIIFVTETIAYDAANCFIYGGVDQSLIDIRPTSDIKEIFEAISDGGCSNVYLSVKLHLFEQMKEFALKEK